MQFPVSSLLKNVLFFVCFTFSSFGVIKEASAHSFLLDPEGDFISFNKPECRMGGPPHSATDNCPGPCIAKSSWQYSSAKPKATYERGQNVTMFWTRNNHEGGFVRFSIVPRDKRMSHDVHTRMAFHYTCYDATRIPCNYTHCGTDFMNVIYKSTIQIPDIYPNGEYVLGWAWFGGIMEGRSYFGDYWTCTDITIYGGGPPKASFNPVFKGWPHKNNTCRSSVDNVAICVREPCLDVPVTWIVPAPFNGSVPDPITAFWKNESATQAPVQLALPSPMPRAKKLNMNEIAQVLVDSVDLVNVKTNTTITSNFYRTIKIPHTVTDLTFVANTVGKTSNVTFFINDGFVRTELVPPYSCFGDSNGHYHAWEAPILDKWICLNVSAISPDNYLNYKVYWLRLTRFM